MIDKLMERNPQILGGTAVFAGTRVPVRILMEHLEVPAGCEQPADSCGHHDSGPHDLG